MLLDGEREVGERDDAAELHSYVVDLEQRHSCDPRVRRERYMHAPGVLPRPGGLEAEEAVEPDREPGRLGDFAHRK